MKYDLYVNNYTPNVSMEKILSGDNLPDLFDKVASLENKPTSYQIVEYPSGKSYYVYPSL